MQPWLMTCSSQHRTSRMRTIKEEAELKDAAIINELLYQKTAALVDVKN